MALTKCRECGNDVSDSAPTCPRCGCEGPAGIGRLVVVRKKQLMGAVLPVGIIIDGVGRGSVRPGREEVIELRPGKYKLEITNNKTTSGGQIAISSGKTIRCLVSISPVNGSIKVDLDDQ